MIKITKLILESDNENITYDEFIKKIIDTRGQWSQEVLNSEKGCEMHHIVPACMGGEGDYVNKITGRSGFRRRSTHPNCIYLYPEEHFRAHELLYKEHPEIFGLYAAWVGTTKNGLVDIDDYADLKKYNHNLPQEVKDKIEKAGNFHYKKRLPPKTNRKYSSKEQALKHGVHGEKNGMFGNGHRISGGLNGHASIRYFYKDKVFESGNELLDYLHDIGENFTRSALRAVVHGTGTYRVYSMYKDVIDNLDWEYKD